MKFSRQPSEHAIEVIAKTINEALGSSRNVLWLVCGGSNVQTQVAVMQQLRNLTPEMLSGLTILVMDERYGKPGHADSNYHQLKAAGFEPSAATCIDVLAADKPFPETVQAYRETVASAFARSAVVIGTFGLGADGHTAGVLPDSPAVTDSEVTVIGYETPGFTRMTITPSWLVRCNIAFVLAYGDSKEDALNNLQKHMLTLEKMPAGLLHDIPNVTVYNDYIGDEE